MTLDRDMIDDNLMTGLAGEGTASFRQLCLRYHSPVFNYLCRLCGDYHRAQELTQETFLSAFQARDTYLPQGRFRAWLFRIATNHARSDHQRLTRESFHLEELAHASAYQPDPPEADAESAERRQLVQAALLRLPLDERAVVVLRHYRGLRFHEIADVLDIPPATARSRMRYALGKLSQYLGPQFKETS